MGQTGQQRAQQAFSLSIGSLRIVDGDQSVGEQCGETVDCRPDEEGCADASLRTELSGGDQLIELGLDHVVRVG